MFRRYAPAGVVLAVVVGLLLLRPWESASPGVVSDRSAPQATVQRAALEGRAPGPREAPVEKAVAKKTKITAQERERYRRAIQRSIDERSATKESTTPSHPQPDQAEPPEAGEGGGLEDRSDGKLAGLMKDLQKDVMPLADECYEQALERDPALAGGLDLQFEIIGDEDVGGLVESVTLVEDSDIQDTEMIECLRETLLSTIFPAPDDSGSTAVELSLRFAPDEPE